MSEEKSAVSRRLPANRRSLADGLLSSVTNHPAYRRGSTGSRSRAETTGRGSFRPNSTSSPLDGKVMRPRQCVVCERNRRGSRPERGQGFDRPTAGHRLGIALLSGSSQAPLGAGDGGLETLDRGEGPFEAGHPALKRHAVFFQAGLQFGLRRLPTLRLRLGCRGTAGTQDAAPESGCQDAPPSSRSR